MTLLARLGGATQHLTTPSRRAAVIRVLPYIAAGLIVIRAASVIDQPFWHDEATSVGVASHGWTEIPWTLLRDGSPPLYYLLLHGWTLVFGNGEASAHALSLIFAAGTPVIAAWATAQAFPDGDRRRERAMFTATCLATGSHLVAFYAVETRMYTLMACASLWACGEWLRVVVHGSPHGRWRFPLAVATAAYTHNWFVYLAAALTVATATQVSRHRGQEGPAVGRRFVLGGLGAVGLYLPWAPFAVRQALHTGAPWALSPSLPSLIRTTTVLVGGAAMLLLLLVLPVIRIGRTRFESTGPGLLAGGIGGLAAAWLLAQTVPSWAQRYSIALLGPVLVGIAIYAASSMLRSICISGTALLLAVESTLGSYTNPLVPKSVLATAAVRLDSELSASDRIVAGGDALPLLRYYLGGNRQYLQLESAAPVDDAGVYDYRNSEARLRAADGVLSARTTVDQMPVGARLLFVDDVLDLDAEPPNSWWRVRRDLKHEWLEWLAEDPRLLPVSIRLYTTKDANPASRRTIALLAVTMYERVGR